MSNDPSDEPLTQAEVLSAIAFTSQHFDSDAVRFIQTRVGAHVDGQFGQESAQAVARFQRDRDLPVPDGKVGANTITALLATALDGTDLAQAFKTSGLIRLSAQLNDLDLGSVLTVSFRSAQSERVVTTFEAGSARVVLLGSEAFIDAASLLDAVREGLETPPVPLPPEEPRPDLLTSTAEGAAVTHNREVLRDPRSVAIIQFIVGARPDGILGPGTVERIAGLQDAGGEPATGRIDLPTLLLMHARLSQRQDFNAAIRVTLDFFDLNEAGILDVSVDDDLQVTFAAHGAVTISAGAPSPSVVRVQSSSLANVSSGAATLTHELEHVRQLLGVELRTAEFEFGAYSEALLLPGLRQIRPVGVFIADAETALNFWDSMFQEERQREWERFERLRAEVQQSVAHHLGQATTTTGQGELLAEVRARYEDVQEPV